MARTLRVKRLITNPHRIDSSNNVVPIGAAVTAMESIPFNALRGIRIDYEIDEEQSDDTKTVIDRINLVADVVSQIPIVSSQIPDDGGTPTPIIIPVGIVTLGTLSILEPARIANLESDADLIIEELVKNPSSSVTAIFDWDFKDYDV